MSVCLSVCDHISGNTLSNFADFSLHLSYDGGLVLI